MYRFELLGLFAMGLLGLILFRGYSLLAAPAFLPQSLYFQQI